MWDNNSPEQNSVLPSDFLALERTKLANDRTLLAFIRTSLAFFAAAAALVEFFHKSMTFEVISYIMISLGVIFLLVGLYNYYRTKKSIKAMKLLNKYKIQKPL